MKSYKGVRRFFKQTQRAVVDRFGTVREDPIIVLGNQKSGTSVIAHLLADIGELSKTVDVSTYSPEISVGLIQGRLQFADFVQQNKSYFSSELIKEPIMTFFADQVVAYFPKARYVFVIRDPRDNIRSLLNRQGNIPGNLTEVDSEIIQALPGKYRILADPDLWGGYGENYIGVLANRWNRAVEAYLRHRERMVLVKYEDFLLDKIGYIDRLAAQVGIPARSDISQKVDIQYQPAGDKSVSWQEFFGEFNLKCIDRVCGEYMAVFGYGLSGDGR